MFRIISCVLLYSAHVLRLPPDDYFYAVIKNNKVALYYSWQNETKEDDGFHWKRWYF